MWARDWENCINCNTIEIRHIAKGLCNKCYLKKYRDNSDNKVKSVKLKAKWYQDNKNLYSMKLKREQLHFSGKRVKVLNRDNHSCQDCGSDSKLIVHHIDGNGRGNSKPNNVMKNLITLCRACHAKIHGYIDRWARNFDNCISCETIDIRHNAKGLCINCYAIKNYKLKI